MTVTGVLSGKLIVAMAGASHAAQGGFAALDERADGCGIATVGRHGFPGAGLGFSVIALREQVHVAGDRLFHFFRLAVELALPDDLPAGQ
ncbi:MAG: hypothetical protein CMM07_17800 [Rhodopirellula sp.]|nr:hypothetical protein [Rhodopirellula sp.]